MINGWETPDFEKKIHGDLLLRKVFAWCQKIIQEGEPVTPGICPERQEREVGNTSMDRFSGKEGPGGRINLALCDFRAKDRVSTTSFPENWCYF
jgi:hypothetical protein